jgi:hypothetical protein
MYGFVINALLSVVAGEGRIAENWVWRYPKTPAGSESLLSKRAS